MKNTSIYLIAFLILLFTVNLNANIQTIVPGSLIVRIKQTAATATFSLQIANLQQLKTSIILRDLKGEIIHSKQIEESNGIQIKYIMGEFPDGLYYLEINWNKQVKTWKVYKNKEFFEFQIEDKKQKKGVWLIPAETLTSQE